MDRVKLKERLMIGAGLLAAAALGACSSNGHGMYLATNAGAGAGGGAAGSGGSGGADSSGGSGSLGGPGVSGGAGASGGTVGADPGAGPGAGGAVGGFAGGASGGGGGGGGATPTSPPTTVVTSADGVVTRASDLAGGLGGGVLHVAGNAALVGSDLLTGLAPESSLLGGLVNTVVAPTAQVLTATGDALAQDGLAGLPVVGDAVTSLASTTDAALSGAATLSVANASLTGGGGESALGLGVLSQTQPTGSVATAGVLSGGDLLTLATAGPATAATPLTVGGTADQLLSANLGGSTLPTGSGTPLISAAVASPTGAAPASLVGVSVLSGGQPLAVSVSGDSLAGLTGGLTSTVDGGGALAGVLTPPSGGTTATLTEAVSSTLTSPATAPVTAVVEPVVATAVSTVASVADAVVSPTTSSGGLVGGVLSGLGGGLLSGR